jgi:predicted nucleic acid-binding protein
LIVAVDTSVIVAALSTWDVRYESTRRTLDRLAGEHTMILPLHVLLESYSVMTRLPPPLRTTPEQAFEVLRSTFGHMPVAGLAADDVWQLLESFANRGMYGGRIYDAVIAHAARKAGAEAILTFNVRDFLGEGLQVLSP